MMKRLIALTAALFNLAACQSTGGGGCPPLVNYSADQMKRAAAEMRALHKDAELRRLVTDYGKFRDACRVK
jgi:hypothetical protein